MLQQLASVGGFRDGFVKILQSAVSQVVQNVQSAVNEETHKLRFIVLQGISHGFFKIFILFKTKYNNLNHSHYIMHNISSSCTFVI